MKVGSLSLENLMSCSVTGLCVGFKDLLIVIIEFNDIFKTKIRICGYNVSAGFKEPLKQFLLLFPTVRHPPQNLFQL